MGSEAVPLNYLPILVFIVIACAFGAVSLLLGWVVRPSRPYRAKLAPYESGSPLFSDARIQFPMRYYIIAMLFVIFDIEIVFLFPWAVSFKKLGLVGLIEMTIFIAILVVGFWYAWKKGHWNGIERVLIADPLEPKGGEKVARYRFPVRREHASPRTKDEL